MIINISRLKRIIPQIIGYYFTEVILILFASQPDEHELHAPILESVFVVSE
jgi:hypothetical protein